MVRLIKRVRDFDCGDSLIVRTTSKAQYFCAFNNFSVLQNHDDPLLNADHHFSLFKAKYEKSYATREEHDNRFSVFKVNLRRAKRHQKLDPSAVHGVTKYSDLTPAEFRKNFLGLKRRCKLPSDAQKAPILPTNDLSEDFDWRDKGAVTGVKDQMVMEFSGEFSD